MRRVDPDLLADLRRQERGLAEQNRTTGSNLRAILPPLLSTILQESRRELALRVSQGDALLESSQLEALVSSISERLGFEITGFERDEVLVHLEREQRPFGILQELVDNPDVSDILVTSFRSIAVQKSRRNYQTELAFPSADAYEVFIERLLQKAGATYSTKKPVADGMIGSLARLHVVHRCMCDEGPYLTIRLNRFTTVTLTDLADAGLAPPPLLSYLQKIVMAGNTVLIAGEVGTGKTTLARALASTMPHDESILVIEDTPEIRLQHPHVRYVTTREENVEGAGRIPPSACIRAGMRMAMNRIIFGEIRDAEAAEAFIDVCASGHPGLSTVHARSTGEAIGRLELFLGRAQRGVARSVLSEQVATAVQVIVSINICKVTGRRRIMEVTELGSASDGPVRQRPIFRYQVKGAFPAWEIHTRVSMFREALEHGDVPLNLRDLPPNLELEDEVMFREAAQRAA